jgi:hypothetical protein
MNSSSWVRNVVGAGMLAGAVAALAAPGVADVSWEHRLTVRVGARDAKPQFAATILNDWSTDRHRYAVRLRPSDLNNLPPIPMGMGGAMALQSLAPSSLGTNGPLVGLSSGLWERAASEAAREVVKQGGARRESFVEVGLIDDRAQDLFTAYASPKRQYVQEPLKTTLKRLRIDPWKKIAPRLSQEEPEPLTPRQRARLGAEVRSVVRPFIRDMFKAYFRPLERSRTVAGYEARGYRSTFQFNTGTQKAPAWAQVRMEWWVAPEQEGDELVRSFNKRGQELLREVGWPSSSLWLNEIRPIMWQALPQELHQAVATLLPPEGSANEMFGGTPLLMHLTIVPPPLARLQGGEARVDVALVSRAAGEVAPEKFSAPANFSREPLEPFLKQYEQARDKALDQIFSIPLPGVGLAGRLPL